MVASRLSNAHKHARAVRLLLALLATFVLLGPCPVFAQDFSAQWAPINVTGTARPSPRFQHKATFHSGTGQMFVFGGDQDSPVGGTTLSNEFWTLFPGTSSNPAPRWFKVFMSGTVRPTAYHGFVLDEQTNNALSIGGFVFDGVGPTFSNQTVRFRNVNNSLVIAENVSTVGDALPHIFGHTAVFNPENGRTVLFGGLAANTVTATPDFTNDVRVLVNGTGRTTSPSPWIKLSPANEGPAPRAFHSAAYDSASDRMIVFGGLAHNVSAVALANDVWVLSNASGADTATVPTWKQLTPTGTPPAPRAFHSATFLPEAGAMLVFGGEVDSPTPTALPDRSKDAWVLVVRDDPSDSTNVLSEWKLALSAGTVPAPRSDHTAVFDAAADRVLVFGGLVQTPTANAVPTNELLQTTLVVSQPPPPTANAGADRIVRVGSLVTLDGRASMPALPSGMLIFEWQQIGGPTVTLNNATSSTPTFTPTIPEIYTFSLRVTEGTVWSAPDQVSIRVPILGEQDLDGDVDLDDRNVLMNALGTTVGPNSLLDLDGNGVVNLIDARMLVNLCTRSRCAKQ